MPTTKPQHTPEDLCAAFDAALTFGAKLKWEEARAIGLRIRAFEPMREALKALDRCMKLSSDDPSLKNIEPHIYTPWPVTNAECVQVVKMLRAALALADEQD